MSGESGACSEPSGGRSRGWRRWLEPLLRRRIERRFAGVRWIESEELAACLAGPPAARPLLLDARTAAEFEVSRLEGAQRIDPRAREFGALPAQPCIVVYCSLGYRSAAICQRLAGAGARDVRNLAGGIFQWANEGRALCAGGGLAHEVHPYSALWGLWLYRALRAAL